MEQNKKLMAFAVIAMAAMLCVVAIPSVLDDDGMDAAAGDSSTDPYVVYITKGQTWKYDTTFPASLSPTVTVSNQGASFTATTGTYATVSGKTVTVAIPSNASVSEYYVAIKAATTNPTQVAYQYVKFIIKDVLTLSGTSSAVAAVGTPYTWTPTTNASTVGSVTFSVSPSLPAGLSINASTGVISGTPTAIKTATTYTITATAANPSQVKTTTLNLTVNATLTVTIPTVYAIEGGGQDAAQITTNSAGGVTFSITNYGTLSNGASKVSIDAAGNITVNAVSGDAGTFTITIQVTETSSGQVVTKTFTLVITEQLLYASSPSAGYIVEG